MNFAFSYGADMGTFENNIEDEGGEAGQAAREAHALTQVRNLKTISIRAKCQDMANVTGNDANGRVQFSVDGYIPSDLGLGGGDYVDLTIDLETGTILNWERPSDEALIEAFQLL